MISTHLRLYRFPNIVIYYVNLSYIIITYTTITYACTSAIIQSPRLVHIVILSKNIFLQDNCECRQGFSHVCYHMYQFIRNIAEGGRVNPKYARYTEWPPDYLVNLVSFLVHSILTSIAMRRYNAILVRGAKRYGTHEADLLSDAMYNC